MATLTEQLIDKVLAVNFDTLPAAAIEMAKACTLDGIAVMLAGATEPLGLGRIVTQYVKDAGGNPQATVIAGGFKTSMLNAAYANGTLAHALDAAERIVALVENLEQLRDVSELMALVRA
jgi:2-methylcitrate dehydratase PrpD